MPHCLFQVCQCTHELTVCVLCCFWTIKKKKKKKKKVTKSIFIIWAKDFWYTWNRSFGLGMYYSKTCCINHTKSQNLMCFFLSCSCLYPIHWRQVLSQVWRCGWSSADRRCSNYIWVINNFIAHLGANCIRGFTVLIILWSQRLLFPRNHVQLIASRLETSRAQLKGSSIHFVTTVKALCSCWLGSCGIDLRR